MDFVLQSVVGGTVITMICGLVPKCPWLPVQILEITKL